MRCPTCGKKAAKYADLPQYRRCEHCKLIFNKKDGRK